MELKCCAGGQAQMLATRLIEATEREGETGKVLLFTSRYNLLSYGQ